MKCDRGQERQQSKQEGYIWLALSRASAVQEYCGTGTWGRDVRIVGPIVEALGSCGIRVSGISEGVCASQKRRQPSHLGQ